MTQRRSTKEDGIQKENEVLAGMKKIKTFRLQKLGDAPIGTKLNIVFVLMIVVPVSCIGIILSALIKNMQMEQIQKSSEQDLVQSMQGIENSLAELDNIIISNLWNEELLEVLRGEEGYISSPEGKNTVNRLLRNIANTRRDVSCLTIIAKNGDRFYYSGGENYRTFRRNIYTFSSSGNEFYEEAYKWGETIWAGLPELPGHVMGVRRIRDFSTLEDLGVMYVFVKEDVIRQQYVDLKTTTNSFFVIRDAGGQIVSTNKNDIDREELQDTNSEGFVSFQGERFYAEKLENTNIGWTIQEFTPRGEIMWDIYRMQLLLISFILIVVGILVMLIHDIAHSITQPIRNLREKMSEVRNENLDVVVIPEHKDEVGELSEAFNEMICRIKDLIEKDYRSRILLRESELKFLRAQINPHFLYNTLDSISWLAALNGSQEVSRMAVSLGRILRWSISNTDNIVLLKEETAVLEDYLAIQKYRYGEKLHFEIHIEEPELSMYVPKMILQPLAENALIHGLEELEGDKWLIVRAYTESGRLHILVEDNGIGMEGERIREIMAGTAKGTGTGVGIINVHKRIQLHYGKEYGLSIESQPGKGTLIHILLPEEKGE